MAAVTVVFITTVGDYVTLALVGGPNSIMVGSLIQVQFGRANDWPFGAALSVAVMVLIALVIGLLRKADRQGEKTA